MLYEELFRGLAAARIRYVVVGGVALVLHGVVRFTADLDLLVALDPENLDAFLEAMEDLGYKPKLPLRAKAFADPQMRAEWKEMRETQVFTFYHPQRPVELVDVFTDEPIDFAAVERDKQIFTARGVEIPTISIPHLKQLKALSGRPQDLADIQARETVWVFKDLPAEVKLDWLEQAVLFVEAFVSPAKRARWDQRWRRDHIPVSRGEGGSPTPQR